MKKYLLVILILFLCSCDETPLDQINRYSGRWGIVFKDNSGNILREGSFTLLDNGNICDNISFSSPGDSVYFQGTVNSDGFITGQFGDSCAAGNSGLVTGAFTEIIGIVTGTGNWNDTTRTPNSSGIWEARRF